MIPVGFAALFAGAYLAWQASHGGVFAADWRAHGLVRATASRRSGPAGDMPLAVDKNEEHRNDADGERIVTWINLRTGVMDAAKGYPGDAKITLLKLYAAVM